MYIHTYVYMYIYIYIHTYIYTYKNVEHIYTYIHIHINVAYIHTQISRVCTCTCRCARSRHALVYHLLSTHCPSPLNHTPHTHTFSSGQHTHTHTHTRKDVVRRPIHQDTLPRLPPHALQPRMPWHVNACVCTRQNNVCKSAQMQCTCPHSVCVCTQMPKTWTHSSNAYYAANILSKFWQHASFPVIHVSLFSHKEPYNRIANDL